MITGPVLIIGARSDIGRALARAYAARGLGTLKVTPEQQGLFLADAPQYFEPAPGGWGRMGMTLIRLDAPEPVVTGALRTAYNGVAEGNRRAARKKAARSPSA